MGWDTLKYPTQAFTALSSGRLQDLGVRVLFKSVVVRAAVVTSTHFLMERNYHKARASQVAQVKNPSANEGDG